MSDLELTVSIINILGTTIIGLLAYFLTKKYSELNKQNSDDAIFSAVNDMIGAQSTKGIHVISKYTSKIESTGVWKSDKGKLTIIETYPSVN